MQRDIFFALQSVTERSTKFWLNYIKLLERVLMKQQSNSVTTFYNDDEFIDNFRELKIM